MGGLSSQQDPRDSVYMAETVGKSSFKFSGSNWQGQFRSPAINEEDLEDSAFDPPTY